MTVVSLVYFPLNKKNFTKKEERDITTAIMNITFCPITMKHVLPAVTCCPSCNWTGCPKHGKYIRKGFHSKSMQICFQIPVQRYRCKNPACIRATFSVLPPMVLRYCRFFWACLIAVIDALERVTPAALALAWNVGVGVIHRAQDHHSALEPWVSQQYQELYPLNTENRSFMRKVKILTTQLGLTAIMNRWYHKHYPLRCMFTM